MRTSLRLYNSDEHWAQVNAGYLHSDYAASFSEFGTPCSLQRSKGWLIARTIPGTDLRDAMGCYPLFCCSDWRSLADDLTTLDGGLLSVVIVADPLGNHTPALLQSAFDFVTPFKEHYVIETGRPLSAFVNRTHRDHARLALKRMDVSLCDDPTAFVDEWERLFSVLAERHGITGLRRFSRGSFEKQLAVPGLRMFRAAVDGRTIGLDLWYLQGDRAHGHLAAFDATGYDLHASYATKWRAIEYLSTQARWINLGAGNLGNPDGGLSRFKRGWATGTRTAFLCGRVLQPDRYAELVRAAAINSTGYFPAYRAGEFG